MASKKGIDNPFGKMTDYPKPDSFEFDPTKLSPKEQAQLMRDSVDIDDPFEGKKLTDLEEWDKKSKGKGKGMAKRTGEKGMSKARAGAKTGRAWSTAEKAKQVTRSAPGKKGVQSALKAAPRALGAVSRIAPPIAAGLAARDIYTGLKDPNFMTGLMKMFGGEEEAYNAWVAQEAEEGNEHPPYEEWRAHAEKMAEAGELDPDAIEERSMPDTREVAKRALAPRYEQEMGPEDME